MAESANASGKVKEFLNSQVNNEENWAANMMGKQNEEDASATWETNDVMIFCDLCIQEIELGNRPTTHFSKAGWNNLVVKFAEQTGKSYDKVQMENKWDHLKKEWKLWHELKRGETGLGWNSLRKTIDASDKWWDERIKVVPNAKKFQFGGIHPELEEKMNMMFRSVVAIGNFACTPHCRSVTRESVDDTENSSSSWTIFWLDFIHAQFRRSHGYMKRLLTM